MNRHPKIFTNPETFDPSRWLLPRDQYNKLAKRMWAYSSGPHACIGRELSQAIMKTTIVDIYTRYSTTLHDPHRTKKRPWEGADRMAEVCFESLLACNDDEKLHLNARRPFIAPSMKASVAPSRKSSTFSTLVSGKKTDEDAEVRGTDNSPPANSLSDCMTVMRRTSCIPHDETALSSSKRNLSLLERDMVTSTPSRPSLFSPSFSFGPTTGHDEDSASHTPGRAPARPPLEHSSYSFSVPHHSYSHENLTDEIPFVPWECSPLMLEGDRRRHSLRPSSSSRPYTDEVRRHSLWPSLGSPTGNRPEMMSRNA